MYNFGLINSQHCKLLIVTLVSCFVMLRAKHDLLGVVELLGRTAKLPEGKAPAAKVRGRAAKERMKVREPVLAFPEASEPSCKEKTSIEK